MSAKVTNYYRQYKIKDKFHKLILMILSEQSNEQGTCYPGVSKIAGECSVSERTIQRAISKLEESGEIGRSLNNGQVTSTGKTNLYFLNAYRISVGLEPLITKSPFVGPSVSPRVKSTRKSSQAVTKINSSGDKHHVTQTKYQNLYVSTNTQEAKNLIKNEVATQHQFGESKLHNEPLTPIVDKSARDIESQTVKQSEKTPVRSTGCGDKDFLIKEETPTDLIFPVQMSKVEQAEVQKVLIQNKIPHQEWQDIIDTLAHKMKQESVPSKAGYIVGIVKAFKNGTFTKEAARKIQSKRAPKQTSANDLKNKVEQMAQRNAKPVIDEKTAKVIEVINSLETKEDLQKIYRKIYSLGDFVSKAWSKRFNEVRA